MESSSTSRRRAGSAPPVSATSSRADSTPYEPTSDADGTRKRLDYLAEADLDLAIFQLIPLYVRSRVLKEGKVLFLRDEDRLYAVAIRTVKAWEDFRHIHRMYLDAVARG